MMGKRFDLSEEEEIRAEIIETDANPVVSFWVYRKTKEGNFLPTEKGLKIPLALFRHLKEAILELEKTLANEEQKKSPEEKTEPLQEKKTAFAHPSEEELANLLDFYQIRWLYEPHSFAIKWDNEGNVVERFTPDFYLPDQDLYLELTTMKQNLVTKKNKKVRRLKKLYPEVNIKVFYGRDYRKLLLKYGIGKQE